MNYKNATLNLVQKEAEKFEPCDIRVVAQTRRNLMYWPRTSGGKDSLNMLRATTNDQGM